MHQNIITRQMEPQAEKNTISPQEPGAMAKDSSYTGGYTYTGGSGSRKLFGSGPTENQMHQPKAASTHFAGKVLLLVEDVLAIRQIVKSYLNGTGIEVDEADNGAVALQKFSSNPQRYNVILMDIYMPEMDGYEATAKIRQLNTAHAKTVPVIAMTASTAQEDIRRCLDAGMNDHLGKPLRIAELKSMLARHLTRVGSREKPNTLGLPGKLEMSRHLTNINWQKAMELTDHNEQLYLQLLNDFQAQKLFESLCYHLKQEDSTMVWTAAYALKGVTASLAFEKLHQIIVTIEQLSREKQPAAHMLNALKSTYQNTMLERQRLLEKKIG